MAGISSRALNSGAENKIKYNGMELQSKEFSDGMGLEMYEYKYRFYDHQIGRFISQDKLADKYVYYSPYQFAGNEVPNAIDLDGLEPSRPLIGVQNFRYAQSAEAKWKREAAQIIAHNKALKEASANRQSDYFTMEGFHAANDILFNAVTLYVLPIGETKGTASTEGEIVMSTRNAASAALKSEVTSGSSVVAKQAAGAIKTEGGALGKQAIGFPDNANVVRGGSNTPELIKKGTGTHPSGVPGISVECGTCPVQELSKNIPHGTIGTTTVGAVRAAGGDVIKTSGKSPNHATLTGLTPEISSKLLSPVIKKPQ